MLIFEEGDGRCVSWGTHPVLVHNPIPGFREILTRNRRVSKRFTPSILFLDSQHIQCRGWQSKNRMGGVNLFETILFLVRNSLKPMMGHSMMIMLFFLCYPFWYKWGKFLMLIGTEELAYKSKKHLHITEQVQLNVTDTRLPWSG